MNRLHHLHVPFGRGAGAGQGAAERAELDGGRGGSGSDRSVRGGFLRGPRARANEHHSDRACARAGGAQLRRRAPPADRERRPATDPTRGPPSEASGEHGPGSAADDNAADDNAPDHNASRASPREDGRLDGSGEPDSDASRATKAAAEGRDPDRGGGAGDAHDAHPHALGDPHDAHADSDPHGNHAASSSHDDDRQAPGGDPDDPLGPGGGTNAGPQEQIPQKRLRDSGDRLWKRLGDPVDRRLSEPETRELPRRPQ